MPFGFPLLTGGAPFKPSDIPSLLGKVIFITGGNIGLGKETILQLAQHKPAHIYLSARNESKALSAIHDIQTQVPSAPPISFIQCDLTSLHSVQSAARNFTSKEKRLDVLFLNAGIMAAPPGLTNEGYEIQFGTNHVGHFLLTKLLLPTLLETAKKPDADVRVVSLSSAGHIFAPREGILWDQLKSDMGSKMTMTRYGQSKLANILFAKELARRYPQVKSVALHPGVVNTDLYNSMGKWPLIGWTMKPTAKLLYVSVADGAKNQLWAATTEDVQSGEYYTPIGVTGQGSKVSGDQELAKKLWVWTDEEVKGYAL